MEYIAEDVAGRSFHIVEATGPWHKGLYNRRAVDCMEKLPATSSPLSDLLGNLLRIALCYTR
jgi:hypothetical protein